MNYKDAVRSIAEDYKRRKSEYAQAELDALSSDPKFAECEKKKRDLLLRRARGERIDEKLLAATLSENEELRKRLGLIPPSPRCSKCGDSGLYRGKFCECAVSLALRSQSSETGIPLHDFDGVDFSVYGTESKTYEKLFSDIATVCRTYPANKKRCIVISGGTGTGKTYLAGCAAREVLERGMSVSALTAFALNNRFREYHTCFDGGKADILDPLLDCTLLVIDDLGTESVLRNVTVEYLYQVINERNLSGKLTLITTNLAPAQILERYGDRIYSRMFDKSLSYAKYIKAKDLRKAF